MADLPPERTYRLDAGDVAERCRPGAARPAYWRGMPIAGGAASGIVAYIDTFAW